MKDTHVNMFGGSPLNRLSWLRSSPSFLNGIISSPNTRWLLFNAGQPLLSSTTSDQPKIAFLSTNEVRPFLGPEPFFNQGKNEGEVVPTEQETHFTEAARHRGVPIVFLGLHEPSSGTTGALPSSDFSKQNSESAIAKIQGTPYFSLDVSDLSLSEQDYEKVWAATEYVKKGEKLAWHEPRSVMNSMSVFEGGVYAEARSMTDWNWRNKFCPGCGSPQYSLWGGWKIACSTLLPWVDNSNRRPCPSGKGLQNYAHPRSDAVVIMCAIDQSGEKILLGRSRKFPLKFYSALAGFIEPGETFEDAVKREMWEEAGVKVWGVEYHSGQPWPYPANLMVGFYARADSTKPVRTDLDNELIDARWYTREEIKVVIGHKEGMKLDYKKLSEHEKRIAEGKAAHPDAKNNYNFEEENEKKVEELKPEEPPFRIPPTTAIAGVLIRDWAEGKVRFAPVQIGEVGERVVERGANANL